MFGSLLFTLAFLIFLLDAARSRRFRTVSHTRLRFEISFPKEVSVAALDGHVLVLIATNDRDEPRFQIGEQWAQSQQAFGVDVDGLAPGAPALIDAQTFGLG